MHWTVSVFVWTLFYCCFILVSFHMCHRLWANAYNFKLTRLAVDMDIHGYIHVWIGLWDLGRPVDISMDIMLAHRLIKLNTYMLCVSIIFSCLSFLLCVFSLFTLLSQMNNQWHPHAIIFNQPKLIYQYYTYIKNRS